MPAQIVQCRNCNKVIAACTEPECFTDRDWKQNLTHYVREGFIVKTVDSNNPDFRNNFGECQCGENKPKYIQLELFMLNH